MCGGGGEWFRVRGMRLGGLEWVSVEGGIRIECR